MKFESSFTTKSLLSPICPIHSNSKPNLTSTKMGKIYGGSGAGGGPPGMGRAPGARRPKPPFPKEYGFGVCGLGKPKIFFVTQLHLDELPAVTGATIYAPPPLLEELKEKLPFYVKEDFGNEFVEFRGEYLPTHHTICVDLPNGVRREVKAKSCCLIVGDFAYIDESVESEELLAAFREKGLIPLFHWQPRTHFDRKYAITHRDIQDGYLLDNRVWKPYAKNVIPKCVPSIYDVKRNPKIWRDNPFSDLFV